MRRTRQKHQNILHQERKNLKKCSPVLVRQTAGWKRDRKNRRKGRKRGFKPKRHTHLRHRKSSQISARVDKVQPVHGKGKRGNKLTEKETQIHFPLINVRRHWQGSNVYWKKKTEAKLMRKETQKALPFSTKNRAQSYIHRCSPSLHRYCIKENVEASSGVCLFMRREEGGSGRGLHCLRYEHTKGICGDVLLFPLYRRGRKLKQRSSWSEKRSGTMVVLSVCLHCC